MRDKCFDEGMIQAFFDGELESNLLEQVARHVSDCDPCAVLMSEIEAESASVTAAFEIENFELVPTERLRTKIFAEIAEYENGGSSWLGKAAAALGFSGGFRWTSPSVAAFASLVLVAGVVAFLVMSRPDVSQKLVAENNPPKIAVPAVSSGGNTVAPAVTGAEPPIESVESVDRSASQARRVAFVQPKQADNTDRIDVPRPAGVQPLDDEERYLQTIKTLKSSVDTRKGDTLKPSALVAYERDMAVIDDAISKMQLAARKNPKDEAAKQILLASYQNKIDLLSAVSEKTELMASLR
ncbi:MAG TPA: hypothetical protein VGO50_18195 [Pyrinomonadaceae bacterium]|jgi:anti-sigma factor RsiW|nr:hypothetical protein [Pyrinomonadaceae bacterium]